MNILTFDIEEWYLYKEHEKHVECDHYLDAILDKLDEYQIKATFFCLGEMGRLFPEVVRKIQVHGHEIGCHSNVHTWLNKMTKTECREDTHCAVDSLEQCIGEKVKSYRAPAFSIGENNKWAFEILVENGIERDASVFPAARDFGGFPSFGQKTPCIIDYNGIKLKEFPVRTVKVMGKEMAYSGGGYFRFFPFWFIENQMKNSTYNMTYFHIDDLMPETGRVQSREAYESYFRESGTLINRYKRYLKSNLGKKHALAKMQGLIESNSFLSLVGADKVVDWANTQVQRL